MPVTIPSISSATSSPDGHGEISSLAAARRRSRSSAALSCLVAAQPVVVDAPVPAEVGRRGDEAGEELGDVGVGGAGQHAELPEELELDPVVGHHVGLGPVVALGDLEPVHPLAPVPSRSVRRRGPPDRRAAIGASANPSVAADPQRGHQREVVDAGGDRVDRVHRGVEQQAHRELEADQLVAQPHHPDLRLAADRPAERGQRVADVDRAGRPDSGAPSARATSATTGTLRSARADAARARRCRRPAGECRSGRGSRGRGACWRTHRPRGRRSRTRHRRGPSSRSVVVADRQPDADGPWRCARPTSTMSGSESGSTSMRVTSASCSDSVLAKSTRRVGRPVGAAASDDGDPGCAHGANGSAASSHASARRPILGIRAWSLDLPSQWAGATTRALPASRRQT